MTAPLVAADIGGIISLIIFVLVIVNLLREVARRSRQEREELRQSEQRPSPTNAKRPPQRAKPTDEIDRFLEDLAREAGLPLPPRPAPEPPRTAPPAPTAQRVERPAAKKPVARPVARKIPPTPAPVTQPVPHIRPLQPSLKSRIEQVMPATADAEPVEEKWQKQRFEEILPKDLLHQAVILKEVLGPCRALRPHWLLTR